MKKLPPLFVLLLAAAGTSALLGETVTAVPPSSSPAASLTPPVVNLVPTIQDTETKEQRDARMAWWREARFGMFIHWGIYSVPAQGEWYMYKHKVSVADYSAFARQFNPTKFNADTWAQLAHDAGMKYLVITAKHHDGFSMFPTQTTDYNIIAATPYKQDVLGELATACRKRGIKFGIYYSIGLDWYHPGGDLYTAQPWDPAQVGDNEKFVQTIVMPECRELLERYHPDLWWWDGSGQTWSPKHPDRAAQLQAIFAPYRGLIINNRMYDAYRPNQYQPGWFADTGHAVENFVRGDYATPENTVPATVPADLDWETNNTINGSWGFNVDDLKFKSATVLLEKLIDIASKGGNFLLNVGPDATGLIPAPEVDRLKEMGRWINVNGEAIYGTGRSPFTDLHGSYDPVKKDKEGKPIFHPVWDYRCTTKPGKIYVHLFQWPTGVFKLPAVAGTVGNAHLLADPAHAPLKFTQTATEVAIDLPAKALDPIATVLVLETK